MKQRIFTEADLVYLDEAINYYITYISDVRERVQKDTSLSFEQRKEELSLMTNLIEDYCILCRKVNSLDYLPTHEPF